MVFNALNFDPSTPQPCYSTPQIVLHVKSTPETFEQVPLVAVSQNSEVDPSGRSRFQRFPHYRGTSLIRNIPQVQLAMKKVAVSLGVEFRLGEEH